MAKEPPKLHAVDDITPVTVGNPAAASALAIDQSHLEEYANPGAESAVVECRRPAKGHFFTVRPEPGKPWKDRAFYFLLQIEGRDPYIVAPAIAKQKKEEDTIRPVLIVRYVTMAGEEGLWALKLDPPDGKSNNWNTSALNILETRGERQMGSDCIDQKTLSTSGVEENIRGGAAEVYGPLV